MNVGSIIKYYRTKKGLTQTELAEGICSTSHLSKIETNMYTANEETLNLLLEKLDLRLEDEGERMAEVREILQDFIKSIMARDTEQSEIIYNDLISRRDYMETSDFVNMYHLYMYRYYQWREMEEEEKQVLMILQRIKTTFTSLEENIFTLFQAIKAALEGDSEKVVSLVNRFLENPLPLGRYWAGEAYYLLASSHSRFNQPEAAIMYGKKAFDIFEDESNWTRIIHAQMIMGINYMRLRLFTEANAVYEPLLRNSRLFFRDSFYPQILINYARCLQLSREYSKAKRLAEEAMSIVPADSMEYAIALLCWIEIEHKTSNMNKHWVESVEKLRQIALNLNAKYYVLYATYYEKIQFSQVEATEYAIKYLYPHLIKNRYYDDALEFVDEITEYYNNKGNIIKLKYYYDQWKTLVEKERSYHGENA